MSSHSQRDFAITIRLARADAKLRFSHKLRLGESENDRYKRVIVSVLWESDRHAYQRNDLSRRRSSFRNAFQIAIRMC